MKIFNVNTALNSEIFREFIPLTAVAATNAKIIWQTVEINVYCNMIYAFRCISPG